MSIEVKTSPDRVTTKQLGDWLAQVGIPIENCFEVRIDHEGICATVFARGDDGKKILGAHSEGYVKHQVTIAVIDDSPTPSRRLCEPEVA